MSYIPLYSSWKIAKFFSGHFLAHPIHSSNSHFVSYIASLAVCWFCSRRLSPFTDRVDKALNNGASTVVMTATRVNLRHVTPTYDRDSRKRTELDIIDCLCNWTWVFSSTLTHRLCCCSPSTGVTMTCNIHPVLLRYTGEKTKRRTDLTDFHTFRNCRR